MSHFQIAGVALETLIQRRVVSIVCINLPSLEVSSSNEGYEHVTKDATYYMLPNEYNFDATNPIKGNLDRNTYFMSIVESVK